MAVPLRLLYSSEILPDGHGADDYEDDEGTAFVLRAFADAVQVGELRFNLKDHGSLIWVRWIETEPAWQRRGVASALLAEALRRYPEAAIATGGTTDEGQALWDHYFGPSL